uniref:Cytochrome c oxidase subunit 2 n=1 Tax=Hapalogenys analis TaxID=360505 RepID=K4P401_9TELE|nr:cytochrome c oxidase subunit II [Hapalogenys analis]AFV57324.1 cytochrome c oxidase subunit II [Hapalogenys analis]QOH92221.1 cytochrome c oxidase subunit II [Hapalogenys analis]UUA63047.1 cytochrome c oxidase subunit II [Girella punctata]WPS66084.1 cytochrome c oxidase subunit II [Hapalogenys analis]
MAHPGQIGFQDAGSPAMEELLLFHDHALMVAFLICAFVLYMIVSTTVTSLSDKIALESHSFEAAWAMGPAFLVTSVSLPSLQILYMMDEVNSPYITVKAVGHQWYWSYEYDNYQDLQFDSYMIPTEELRDGQFRLLDTDHRIVIPAAFPIRMMTSSEDVIHAWAVPALAVKMDAVPGRLNQLTFVTTRPGVYFGQCSEICGANHSFMPIVVEAIPAGPFDDWASSFTDQD